MTAFEIFIVIELFLIVIGIAMLVVICRQGFISTWENQDSNWRMLRKNNDIVTEIKDEVVDGVYSNKED